MNQGSFGMSFDAFAAKTLLRADLLIRAVGIKTFSAVIRDTPVGDPDLWQSLKKDGKGRAINPPPGYVGGRLRGNWNTSLGWADMSTIEHIPGEPYKKDFPTLGETLEKNNAVCNSADRHSVLWLANSLPYAAKIEYTGHSSQAPAGMVRRNVARIKANLASELRKIQAST